MIRVLLSHRYGGELFHFPSSHPTPCKMKELILKRPEKMFIASFLSYENIKDTWKKKTNLV